MCMKRTFWLLKIVLVYRGCWIIKCRIREGRLYYLISITNSIAICIPIRVKKARMTPPPRCCLSLLSTEIRVCQDITCTSSKKTKVKTKCKTEMNSKLDREAARPERRSIKGVDMAMGSATGTGTGSAPSTSAGAVEA